MDEYEVIDDRTKTQKVKDWLEETKKKIVNAAKVYWDNRDTTLPATGVILLGLAKMKQQSNRRREFEAEQDRRDRTIYDPSMRKNLRTTRPLTVDELLEVEERNHDGEPIGMILDDMGLLDKRKRR